MAVPKVQYTPVRSQHGKIVHGLGLFDRAGQALCEEPAPKKGWRVASGTRVSCADCKLAMKYARRK